MVEKVSQESFDNFVKGFLEELEQYRQYKDTEDSIVKRQLAEKITGCDLSDRDEDYIQESIQEHFQGYSYECFRSEQFKDRRKIEVELAGGGPAIWLYIDENDRCKIEFYRGGDQLSWNFGSVDSDTIVELYAID